MLTQLLDHFNLHNLLNSHQSTYREGYSTETALLKVLSDLLTTSDDDSVSILAFLDLSAAFDTIDHSRLLCRLKHSFGISESVLPWFFSYLTDRTQSVCVNGLCSSPLVLKFGALQGSLLGPILFILCATLVSDIIHKLAMLHESFADDT